MCIAFFLWEHPQLPDLQLVAMFNRDEVLGRPTAASHFWRDEPSILGGRDLVAGGTWLCVSRHGRAAFLTNFREMGGAQRQGAPSRGALPVAFVTAEQAPEPFLEGLDSEAYPGFNLVGVDLVQRQMLYVCNRQGGQHASLQRLPPGLHGVTNGRLHPAWPKVREGCRRLQQLIDSGAFGSGDSGGGAGAAPAVAPNVVSAPGDDSGGGGASSDPGASGGGASVPWEELFGLLAQDRLLECDPAQLPATGYGADFEARVSGICVQPVDTPWGPFGTRSKIVLAVWKDGRAELREEYLAGDGSWQRAQHAFRICSCGAGGGGCEADGSGGCGTGCNAHGSAEKPSSNLCRQSEGQDAGQQAKQQAAG